MLNIKTYNTRNIVPTLVNLVVVVVNIANKYPP